ATRLGGGGPALEPASRTGMLDVGAQVRFRHPLVRSAVYRSASELERQLVHRALADATDGALEPDRRAWHRAQATRGPNEDVAVELERSAGRAQARGGLAAAAAFLARAADLTTDASRRAARLLEVSRAVGTAPGAGDPARPCDLLLDGFALVFTEGRAAASPVLRRAATGFAGSEVSVEEVLRWGWLATAAAVYLWDFDTCLAV